MSNRGSLSVFWLKIGHCNRYLDVGSSKPVRFLRQARYGSPFQKISRISSHRSRIGWTVRTLCLMFLGVRSFVFPFFRWSCAITPHFVGADIEMRWHEEASFESREISKGTFSCGLLMISSSDRKAKLCLWAFDSTNAEKRQQVPWIVKRCRNK